MAVYRVDGKAGRIEKLTDELGGPNGICFSPDYKKIYVADTGAPREIRVWDTDGKSIRNGKRFVQLDIPGTGQPSAADGIRCDVDGNVCFGGAKRNRLFMTASESLYSVYVETTGAHIA